MFSDTKAGGDGHPDLVSEGEPLTSVCMRLITKLS
jgi:hypothetical protein